MHRFMTSVSLHLLKHFSSNQRSLNWLWRSQRNRKIQNSSSHKSASANDISDDSPSPLASFSFQTLFFIFIAVWYGMHSSLRSRAPYSEVSLRLDPKHGACPSIVIQNSSGQVFAGSGISRVEIVFIFGLRLMMFLINHVITTKKMV